MRDGIGKGRDRFEGWYLKQQNDEETVAFIPAYHADESGRIAVSLQIVTGARAYQLDYLDWQLRLERTPLRIWLGNNVFSLTGCHIDCMAEGVSIRGDLSYGARTALPGDIMGPFRLLPGMECRHSLFSLSHSVEGELSIGGRTLTFRAGRGYIEGDRGRSFPRRYLWTQCSFQEDCVMVSVAEIPYCGLHFRGCVAAVLYRGEQYLFATYRGVRLRTVGEREVWITQGKLSLRATLERAAPTPLRAPVRGRMERIIQESAVCRARYRMEVGGQVLFDITSDQASFESMWG